MESSPEPYQQGDLSSFYHLSLVKGNKLCPPHVSLFFVHFTEAFLCLQGFFCEQEAIEASDLYV